jgi:hypothetical protein
MHINSKCNAGDIVVNTNPFGVVPGLNTSTNQIIPVHFNDKALVVQPPYKNKDLRITAIDIMINNTKLTIKAKNFQVVV